MTAAYDHEIASEVASYFVNGERAIGVSDPVDMAADGDYFLSRKFHFEAGIYNLKFLATEETVLKIGPGDGAMEVVLTAPAGAVVQTQVYIPPGPQRIDLGISRTTSFTPVFVAFLIYLADKVIYASNAEGWEFETTTFLPDAALTDATDPRRLLPVFSVLPNWANGITERIEFLTDSLESEQGIAQTRALREFPRRSFEAEFLRKQDRRTRLDLFNVGVGRGTFMVPMWHEQFRPEGGLVSGVTTVEFPAGTLVLREFDPGDLVFVNRGDPADYEVLEVESVDWATDLLVFVDGPVRSWASGTRIIPMRRAKLIDKVSMDGLTDHVGQVQMRFELMDTYTHFTEEWGSQYRRFQFYADRADAIQHEYDRVVFMQDNTIGTPYCADPSDVAFNGIRVNLTLFSRAEIVRFRRFLLAARGRTRRFWMPTYMNDLQPTGTISGTEFEVLPTGYQDYNTTIQKVRRFIRIFKRDESLLHREILSIEAGPGHDTITVDIGIPSTQLKDIRRIEFMVASRFDQDQFELMHYVDDGVAAKTSVATRSINVGPGEDLVPVDDLTGDLTVTSTPYPLEVFGDGLDMSFSLDAIRMRPGLVFTEAIDTELTLDDAALRVGKVVITIDPEALDVEISLDEATLVTKGYIKTLEPEALDVEFALDDADLRRVKIEKDLDPEALDIGLTLDVVHLYP